MLNCSLFLFQLKPLYKSYQSALLGEFSDAMNIFWAECYEGSKFALQKRARELADSRLRFQVYYYAPRHACPSAAPQMHLSLQFNNATLVRALITFSAFLVSFLWRVINIYCKSGCEPRVTLLNCVLHAEKYTLSLMSKHTNLLYAVIV